MTPIVKQKTDADILEYYGDVIFDDHFDHITVKCTWVADGWSRNGYGRTREEAAEIALGGVKYIVHKVVRDVGSGQ